MIAMAVRNEYVFDLTEFDAHDKRAIIGVRRKVDKHIVVNEYLAARSENLAFACLFAKCAITEYSGNPFRRAAT